MRALMMGRFQPFHLGHLELVKQILSECDEIIIALTGSQFNYIQKDPFTAGERTEMIHNSLKNEVDLSRCYIIPIENQFNVATWYAYLKATLPKFDKVYSGNEYVKMLLKDHDCEVTEPKFLDRKKFNATNIRKLIAENQDWESLVPKGISDYIKKIDGINRIQVISKTDTKPQEF